MTLPADPVFRSGSSLIRGVGSMYVVYSDGTS